MNLREARVRFTSLLCVLVRRMQEAGYEAAFAEGMDRKTKKDPTSDHMKNSLHELGLAQDIDLYFNGKYQDKSEHHGVFGNHWEGLDAYCKWGGRFGDGNHYSYAPPNLVGNRR